MSVLGFFLGGGVVSPIASRRNARFCDGQLLSIHLYQGLIMETTGRDEESRYYDGMGRDIVVEVRKG